jgi:hypothetical protein
MIRWFAEAVDRWLVASWRGRMRRIEQGYGIGKGSGE